MSDFSAHRAYCSGCDREVTIGLLPAYEVVPGAPIDPAAVVCYDLGHACTGELCPLVGVETSAMRDRLAQAGGKNLANAVHGLAGALRQG
jgi:hypothetical protein